MRGLATAGERNERLALGAEERRQAQDVRGAEDVGQDIGDDGAVLQRIAAAGRGLGAVGEHPPLAVGRAGEIDCQHVQITVRGNGYADQRPQKRGIGVEQRRGKTPLRHQVLRAVEIFEDEVQQLRALNDAGFEEAPFIGGDEKGNDVDLPRPVGSEGIAVDVVGDSVLANAALGAAPAAAQLFRADLLQGLHQVRPVRSRSHPVGRQLVICASIANWSLMEIDGHGTSLCLSPGVAVRDGTRRSSVIGNTAFVSSAGTAMAPGADNRSNRSVRRCLASAAFAGREV